MMIGDRLSMAVWQGRTDPEPDTLRWHQCVKALAPDALPGVGLLGFACDEGVRRNSGRVGAAQGPQALRAALANLAWWQAMPVHDAGDVVCADGNLEAAQARLACAVKTLLDAGHLPVVLGGGHEVAWGSWRGLADHLEGKMSSDARTPRIGIVNLDAHFDLRDHTGIHSSGTPFSQIAAHCAEKGWPFDYACAGISRPNNTRALFARAQALGVRVWEDADIHAASLATICAALTDFAAACDAVHLTMDLDVLPAAEAPGVSAPAAHGVPLAWVQAMAQAVQASGKLRLIEVAELNPALDVDNRTARAGARLLHVLTRGDV